MAQPQILEGTWEELSVHASDFTGKRLRLVILDEGDPLLARNSEETRIAAIREGMGKFADPSRKNFASEELRQERWRDDSHLDRKLESLPQ